LRSECHKRIGFNLAAALKDADEAVRLDPKNPKAFLQRGDVRVARWEWSEARADFDGAIQLDPNSLRAFVSRAELLALCPDAKIREGAQAFKDGKRACELTEWKNGAALEAFAVANAALGDFDEAVKWQKKVLEDAEYMKVAEETVRKRLDYYESRRPG